ncbi:hypothetical protein M427DRAFT_153015 [Gonapodya prolifera JEL478]|uniref:Uncharacterized protein n=1 Tax=Gonapodya prolifera (strain JEL478) TaxID=1344416 RepID=A0A139APD5_GONPJ|nr:hypothetical protein M427DRAFT_153015 [Gonapodya prolifera JEL478]|eukprot:KXS18621.1 hypothetical protein M427DRAFT_153015 [Gonapodya prolifera JEL478]
MYEVVKDVVARTLQVKDARLKQKDELIKEKDKMLVVKGQLIRLTEEQLVELQPHLRPTSRRVSSLLDDSTTPCTCTRKRNFFSQRTRSLCVGSLKNTRRNTLDATLEGVPPDGPCTFRQLKARTTCRLRPSCAYSTPTPTQIGPRSSLWTCTRLSAANSTPHAPRARAALCGTCPSSTSTGIGSFSTCSVRRGSGSWRKTRRWRGGRVCWV